MAYDIGAEIDAGPPEGGADDDNAPIGVPKDYEARVKRGEIRVPERYRSNPLSRSMVSESHPLYRTQQPRYYQKDLYEPAQWGARAIAELQAALHAAGLLDDGFQVGAWDAETRKAYKELLTQANASGMTWEETLGQLGEIAAEFPQPDDDSGPLPLAAEDVRLAAQQAAQRHFGRALTDDELTRFEQAWRKVESPTGGEDAPSIEAFFNEEAPEQNPEEAAAYGFASRAQEFFGMLDSPVNLGTN